MDLRWLLVLLMSLFVLAFIWRDMSGMADMSWTKCKESLFEQVVFKNCTPSSFVTPDDYNNYEENNSSNEEVLPYEPPQN